MASSARRSANCSKRAASWCFPKINFTDAEQVAFTKTLGTFAPERAGGDEVISKITLDEKEAPGTAEYLKGSLYWHIDGTMNDVPILASLLSCRVPSPQGTGNTGFANTYAAYEALSDEKKAEYADLRVLHGAWASVFYYDPEPSLAKLESYAVDRRAGIAAGVDAPFRPQVAGDRQHRQHVVGKSPMESARIIHGLRDWATSEQFSYSHEWSVGDLVIWDNTGTMHRAEAYDPDCGRMMHRTKLEGEEPFE